MCYVLQDGEQTSCGGIIGGELVCDDVCTQKELMLRALINKCRNDFIKNVTTREIWGVDLARFGFRQEGAYWKADWSDLKLPHECEK